MTRPLSAGSGIDVGADVRARGIFLLYGTSWRNRASQRVAAKLGLRRSLSVA